MPALPFAAYVARGCSCESGRSPFFCRSQPGDHPNSAPIKMVVVQRPHTDAPTCRRAAVEQAKDYLRQAPPCARRARARAFYEKIASAILREHPEDAVEYCLQYVQKMKEKQEPTTEGSTCNIYQPCWRVVPEAAAGALWAEKPGHGKEPSQGNDERLAFHIKYLEELVKQNSGGDGCALREGRGLFPQQPASLDLQRRPRAGPRYFRDPNQSRKGAAAPAGPAAKSGTGPKRRR
eukprot:gene45820-60357_t